MRNSSYRTGVPDRLRVFISSTIGECVTERGAARRAVLSLNFEPVQFEREGARAEPPREFYLRKLHDSHVVVGIYRNSYGWVDSAKGMTISGLEDEYRVTQKLGKDFLAYVLKPSAGRDARLAEMLEEMKSGPHVLYFFDDGEDLESRIRDDLTALITDRFTRAQDGAVATQSAASVLRSIFRASPLRVKRSALLDTLTEAVSRSRIVWVVGEAGAGKTALAAEWAEERDVAYVPARGLDPRSILLMTAQELGVADEAELAVPLFEDARSLLTSRWRDGKRWPLVIDDPDDLDAVWAVLGDCLKSSGSGSVILVVRDPGGARPGEMLCVPGFSAVELDALRAIAGVGSLTAEPGDLPVSLRRAAATLEPSRRFATLAPTLREAIGYIALSPAPLSLDDIQHVLGPTAGSAVELAGALGDLTDLIVETPSGFEFVHETVREQISGDIAERPQLRSLLSDRLSGRLATTGRTWAAFLLRREDDPALAEQLANQSLREAVFTGSVRRLTDALEFLAARYRTRAETGALLSVLLSLADARTNQGRPHEVPALLTEALLIANELGDEEARADVELLQASLELRRSASQAALERVRVLQREAEAEGRLTDLGRLFLDEGVAFLGVNDTAKAVPLFRRARDLFDGLGDAHGVEIATRNLIAALATTPDGVAEAERLRLTLGGAEAHSPRYRAWLCNLLVPRLRRKGQFEEAEKMAREAIAIGEELGDNYVLAINHVVLGNVLRDAGRPKDALGAYTRAGRVAQSVGRIDIEGRSSRLLALTENAMANAAAGAERREHATRAELYATHAVGLLSDSFAWGERAYALEERGDARLVLARDDDALLDYADAVAGYLRAADDSEAARLLQFFGSRLEGRADAAALLARAFGEGEIDKLPRAAAWVHAVSAALRRCPRRAAPSVLGVLVRGFMPGASDAWWFDCLVRCLLAIEERERHAGRAGLGPLFLLAILAYSPYRTFLTRDLLTLAGLCLGTATHVTVRYRPGSDLDFIVRFGRDEQILLTVRTEAKRPEAVFVALCIASFLDSFGDELAGILFGDGLQDGSALDVVVFAQAAETGSLADFIAEGLRDKPVATARIAPKDGEEVPIVLLARADASNALAADRSRAGELEFMLARFVDELLHATLGASLDDEIYQSKVRDLLIAVLR